MKLSFKLYAYSSLAAVCLLLLFSYIAHDSLYYAFHFLCTDRVSVAVTSSYSVFFSCVTYIFYFFVSDCHKLSFRSFARLLPHFCVDFSGPPSGFGG